MKKFLSAMVAAAIAFLPFTSVKGNNEVYAAEGGVIKAETVSAEPGKSVDVAIEISGNPGIVALGLNVSYDPECLALPENVKECVEDCKLFADASFTPSGNSKLIPFGLYWEDGLAVSNYTENGILVIMHFNVLETAKSGLSEIEISINNKNTFDVDLNGVSLSVINGGINITGSETMPTTESTTTTTTTTPITTTTTAETTTTTTEAATTSAATTVATTTAITTTTTTAAITTETTTETTSTEATTVPTTQVTTITTTALPQTGNNVPNVFVITISAIMITVAGAFVLYKSGILYIKKTENK